jgi:hypothetical protein
MLSRGRRVRGHRWCRGCQLSYGVGVTFGFATLGVVGFDGRYDYTPLGAVVNLAARLCGHAAAAHVLLDHATHAATVDRCRVTISLIWNSRDTAVSPPSTSCRTSRVPIGPVLGVLSRSAARDKSAATQALHVVHRCPTA